jgi:hypothetical protein
MPLLQAKNKKLLLPAHILCEPKSVQPTASGLPRSFAIDEPRRALLVEAMHPVAQRLPVHGSDLGGVFTAHPVEHRRQ